MRDYFAIDENYVFALVIYDIADDRKRQKLFKCLKGYGKSIQKSAFEVKLKSKKYDQMLGDLNRFKSEMDSIRVYKIVGKSQVINIGSDDKKGDEISLEDMFCII